MTKKQYRDALKKLGWTQVQAAEYLGINERTSRRYALGECKIPNPIATLINLGLREMERGD